MTGQQLKNSILQMAVQGKLVPQDPNDEPASVLLARIRKEKEELIKAGKIKKEKNPSYIFRGADNLPYEKVGKNEPVCIADKVPFDIPDTWEWVRLSTICQLIDGIKMNNKNYHNLDARYMRGKSEPKTINSGKFVSAGSYLILVDGENSGEIFIAPEDGYMGSTFKLLWFSEQIIDKYFLHFIDLNKEILKNSKKGAAIPHLNKELFFNLFLPIPPCNEQKRIVEKLSTLAHYVNEYANHQNELNILNSNFPDMLKKSILQEAVQGKLVPQDTSDEPASVLLERIRSEKQRLIAEGKIKKDKHESVIFRRDNSHYEKLDGIEHCIDGEIPFDIPESWVWVRFFSVIDIATNLVRPDTYADYMHIAPDNIEKATGVLLECRTVQQDKVVSPNHMFYKGQIIYSKIRPLLRKAVIAPFDGLCSADMYPLNTSVNKEYLLRYILSDTFNLQVATTMSSRVKMPKINQDELSNILIPIPPIQEQERIISRVKELFDKITLI
ncbi:restriction endonuclease subunit S [[Ruminococcus] torques]|nr:restriction endonuclease subunit S [[Ruminococcus] torques]